MQVSPTTPGCRRPPERVGGQVAGDEPGGLGCSVSGWCLAGPPLALSSSMLDGHLQVAAIL